jgi:lipoate-protein ligase A
MAVDEALLQVATEEYIQPVLRLYTFAKPSVSAGYFQKLSREDYPGREKVRRITGGGVVLHGCDLTIAFIISSGDVRNSGEGVGEGIYALFSQALVLGLSEDSSQIGVKREGTVEDKKNYECFRRPVSGDLIADGKKLAGCALRRRRGVSLLQGSLRIYDGEADGASSIEKLVGKKPEVPVVEQQVANGFSQALGCPFFESTLSISEIKSASQLEKKYSNPQWNFRG